MASYTAIADVSDSLVTLLRDRIVERTDVVSIDRDEIALVAPGKLGADSDVRLALYLYRVSENASMKNADFQTLEGTKNSSSVSEPPLGLDLNYLLTAFPAQAGTDETSKAMDQQRLLGLAMQVMYDYSILQSEDLRGTLEGEQPIEISLSNEPTDHLTNLWNTFQDGAFQPSVTYHVSPVLIDPTTEEEIQRVQERDTEIKGYPEDERGKELFDEFEDQNEEFRQDRTDGT